VAAVPSWLTGSGRRGGPASAAGRAQEQLEARRPDIRSQVKQGLMVMKIGAFLEPRSVVLPYRTPHRFHVEQRRLGSAARTVRVADGEPEPSARSASAMRQSCRCISTRPACARAPANRVSTTLCDRREAGSCKSISPGQRPRCLPWPPTGPRGPRVGPQHSERNVPQRSKCGRSRPALAMHKHTGLGRCLIAGGGGSPAARQFF
jgi:hypothetical protein